MCVGVGGGAGGGGKKEPGFNELLLFLSPPPSRRQEGARKGRTTPSIIPPAPLPSPLLSQVFVDQPTVPATISILRGLRER